MRSTLRTRREARVLFGFYEDMLIVLHAFIKKTQKTAAAIIDLLVDLNRERGMTIVLVTHSLALAGRADRAVKMLDGLLTQFDPGTPGSTPDPVRSTGAQIGSRGTAPVVEASGLTKSFPGGVLALRGVSLAVAGMTPSCF